MVTLNSPNFILAVGFLLLTFVLFFVDVWFGANVEIPELLLGFLIAKASDIIQFFFRKGPPDAKN